MTLCYWPWHGVAVFKPSQRGFKTYNIPASMVKYEQYLPLKAIINGEEQLLAFIHRGGHDNSISSVIDCLASFYTRRVNG